MEIEEKNMKKIHVNSSCGSGGDIIAQKTLKLFSGSNEKKTLRYEER